MSDSVQFQSGCQGVDLIIVPHLFAFSVEQAIYDIDMAPGLLRKICFDVDCLSIIPGVLVPVGHELLRNAQSEVGIVEANLDKVLEHGCFLSLIREREKKHCD